MSSPPGVRSPPRTLSLDTPSKEQPMRRIALALLPLAILAGCVSAQKVADQAAATGDWKTAEANYAQVLRDEPNNPEKRARWQDARTKALQGAIAKAHACQVSQDWECAFGEADYLVRMEPGSPEYAQLRSEMGRQAAYARLSRANEASRRRDHRAAFDLLAQARAATNDPALQAEAARVQPGIVQGAVKDAQAYRAQQQYQPAIDLLTAAAALDGGVRPQLDQVRAEYDRWIDAQYEGIAKQGDAFMRERRFAEAAQKYDEATKLKRGGRAEALSRYAKGLQAGDAAVQRRDWVAATRGYEDAVKSGMDGTNGYAAQQLERVQLRPYAIRLRSVLVRPIRPDGSPWTGHAGRGYQRVVGLLANAAMDGKGNSLVAGIDLYDALPHENRPNLLATVTLPDGRQFTTASQTALRARFESFVVFATNGLDDRPVAIRVVHQDEGGLVEVGAISVKMSDLLHGGELTLTNQSVVELKLSTERSGQADGSLQGFAPGGIPVMRPAAAPAPPPGPVRTRR
jgi:tetratricopeptide (TPR) repeat protein